jgi:hypothetical protein
VRGGYESIKGSDRDVKEENDESVKEGVNMNVQVILCVIGSLVIKTIMLYK